MIKQLLLMSALVVPSALSATDFFVTPEGAGDKSGSTWENAMGTAEFLTKLTWEGANKTADAHTANAFLFATGTYTFNSTGFVFNSGLTLKGGYDPATGEAATSGRTVFDGNKKERSNGAFFLQPNTLQNADGKKRTISISNIDFENFVANGVWRGGDTNWNYGYASALYIVKCGYAEIVDCNFRNNASTATGTYKDDNQSGTNQPKEMAGAVSLNRVNTIFRNCSFIGNSGNQGGAVKLFYNMGGGVEKNLYTTFDGCYFADNKTTDCGGAIYGRHTQQINVINSTIVGNDAKMGGGIYSNAPGYYDNVVNIVSSTIGGNTATDAGPEVYTNGTGVLNVTNSIIVNGADGEAVADASATTSYKFLGNNYIGKVAEGYTSAESDNISENNTYASIFGDNVAKDGTLRPIKFVEGMNPDEISTIVTGENWPYTVDVAVDQLGNARSAMTTAGALAVNKDSITTGGVDSLISDEETEGDESWYTLMGVRLTDRPTVSGLYIHKGRKVMIR